MVHSSPKLWETYLAPFLQKHCLVLCMGFVALGCVRIISTYSELSLTFDEPSHFACGMEYVENHEYTFLREQPPLSRAMQALGPYLDGVRLSGLSHTTEARLALLARSRSFDRTVFLMRLGNLPFFVLACLVVCTWSWQMFGKAVAVVATGLFTLLPTTLADAGLATTDMSLGATVGAAFLAGVLWAEKPTWVRGLLFGAFLGLASLSKFTALGYVPLTLGLALACYLVTERQPWSQLRLLGQQRVPSFVLAATTAAFMIWAAYWFSFGNVPHTRITLPAPDFFRGIADALSHDRHGHPAFLFGHVRRTGWWYYFPVAVAVKTPIAFLIMLALGVFGCIRDRARIAFLLPLVFGLGILLPAMAGRIDIGIRHIEPIYIGLSITAAIGLVQLLQWSRAAVVGALSAGALVAWMIISVAVHHPDYVAYFNGFVGENPQEVLVDSNYDWGQDLKLLSKHLHELGVEQFSLMTLDGVGDPFYLQSWYGLPRIQELDEEVPALGWNVISPTLAKSVRYAIPLRPPVAHPWYDQIPATAKVGALLLYNVGPSDRMRFLSESVSHKVVPQSATPGTDLGPAPKGAWESERGQTANGVRVVVKGGRLIAQ